MKGCNEMKKLLSSILILAFTVSLAAGCNNDTAVNTTTTDSSAVAEVGTTNLTSKVPLDTFIVGSGEMNGDFISGFGSNTYDQSIANLVDGYIGTYTIDDMGKFTLNETVVKNHEISVNDNGDKTYTFTIHDDLYWNNGDQMTAKEFVASVLWFTSPEWIEAGASTVGYDGLVGYDDYHSGTSETYAGVKLIDDMSFSVTIAADSLPYYWEALYASVGAIHLDTYLPNCEIISDDTGSKFVFSEGDLLSNCLRIAETERYAPTVTSGPYSFVSYENKTVTLQKNNYFKGDSNGNKPTFEYVIQKAIPAETNAEWVISGEVDYVAGVVESEKIEAVKASDTAKTQSYLRSGYGFLAMLCDYGPTADVNMRWALASLIDRSAVVEYVLGGYGGTVDSEYGVGQWMYQEMAAELQEELIPISFNINTANDYLDKTEWIYEADGTTSFDRTKALSDGSYLRHNSAGEKLVINHLGMDKNVLTDIIEIQYAANAPLAGIEFNLTKSEWNSVLENYYYAYEIPAEDRVYNTFNLATNFTAVFDRYYSWHSSFVGTLQNKAQLADAELDEAIIAMREGDPNDVDAYLDAWLNYELRWNELMPQIPLYSNEYYDVMHVYVDNLNTTAYATYDDLICEVSKSVK